MTLTDHRHVPSTDLAARSTQEVFEDHLRLRLLGDLEQDLARNYAEDVVLLTSNSNLVGHDALRTSSSRLREQLPDAEFQFLAKQVRGRFALLNWRSTSDRYQAVEGADSFVIENGKIVLQTIHYKLLPEA
ncbi:hypothetical protein ABID21_000810 [Pseudorhizobium tarimense]|uniref:SnoaL-like domain-containing protein n=1 Tax=Pseudorhizobium tarimense TaxID=1079109 RepID=A0ABV2H2E1_9HYPH|nr:nuclear transport factor 2 family protein [Pseudorhizobium tarimense]MCJ8517677.1 nuclear transport factor 2 family protein [Pseudorhizobium tarimense]